MGMNSILFKAIWVWLIIVVVAIVNGVFREYVLMPSVGVTVALPLSGMLLASLIFLITLMSISYFDSSEPKVYIYIGIFWVALTLSFEFLFGYFVIGKSWQDIMQVFSMEKGDLFIPVLFIAAISPWVAVKLTGVL